MIKARLEAKNLRICLTCITIFIWGVIICAPFLGLLSESLLYTIFPFLNFGLTISGTVFGYEIPAALSENFSFALSIACVMAAIGLAIHLIYVIVLNFLRGQRRKAKRILRKSGYSREYFELLEKKREHLAGSSLEPTNDLCIAKEYCDGRMYDRALEVLRDVNIDDFDLGDAIRYYSLYAYIFALTGDLKNVEFALELAEPFIEKNKGSMEADLVRGIYSYAKLDFDGAKNILNALLKTGSVEIKVWAGMYLGLIYLRTFEKEKARKVAVLISGYKKTPRQSEDMLKLLKKIEAAYAAEAQEAADKTRAEFIPA